jgi:hypothetical protein
MSTRPALALLLAAACTSPSKAPDAPPLARRYAEGETARYVMTGTNQGRERTITYAAEAEARVVLDEQGRFVEEFRWTKLAVAGQDMPLDERTAAFRQRLSLDPRVEMTPPDISGINPMLIGPVFDLMTFYVDLHPSLHQGRLLKPGDRIHVPHGQPNSWADGTHVTLGEDCIDFDLALESVEPARARLRVRHVPPKETTIRLPAAWMQERVHKDAPNNWAQVQRGEDGFVAAAGHEIFDVAIEIERPSGCILSATMDNPVDIVQRHCADESLKEPGEPARYRIHRRIELRRVP